MELSRLMGIGPDECSQSAEVRHLDCSWRANSRTYGHAILAASIGVHSFKKVRLECTLPDDGSARSPGSCSVSIGY